MVSAGPILVPLQSRRRRFAQLLPKFQHVALSVGLLFEGLERVTHSHEFDTRFALGIAETLTAGFVIVSFVRSVRSARRAPVAHEHAHKHGLDWVDVGLAFMFLVEAATHHADTGHWPRPTLLMAAATLVAGLLHGKHTELTLKKRGLRITDDGIRIGGRFLRKFDASWDQIAGIRISDKQAVIERKHGANRVLDFADLDHAPKIRHALEEAQRRLAAHRGEPVPAIDSTARPSR